MKTSLTFSNTFSCSYATENPYVEKGFLSWQYSAIWGSVFRKEGRSQCQNPAGETHLHLSNGQLVPHSPIIAVLVQLPSLI